MDMRTVFFAGIFVLVEASVWTLIDGLPKWTLVATVVIGALAMCSLFGASRWPAARPQLDCVSWGLLGLYVAMLGSGYSLSRPVMASEASAGASASDKAPKLLLALEGPDLVTASTGYVRSSGYVQVRNTTEATTVRGVKIVLEVTAPIQRRYDISEPFDLDAGDRRRVQFLAFPAEGDFTDFKFPDGSTVPAIDGSSGKNVLVVYTARLIAVAKDTPPASVECGFNITMRDGHLVLDTIKVFAGMSGTASGK